jgi:ankyrin repeat protein
MTAAAGGHEQCVQLLLDHGANIAAVANDGLTALLAAGKGGHEQCVQLLLDRGANVADVDMNGAMH